MNPFLVVGVLLNSALYLTGCFVAGIVTDNDLAWRLALAAAGVTYLSYLVQAPSSPFTARGASVFVLASIALGAAAGIALLIG